MIKIETGYFEAAHGAKPSGVRNWQMHLEDDETGEVISKIVTPKCGYADALIYATGVAVTLDSDITSETKRIEPDDEVIAFSGVTLWILQNK